jgi:cellulose synthase/poly-beta-1,6-N-acetylglucosamine synthase-like glycosyltransferase
MNFDHPVTTTLTILFVVTQVLYLLTFLLDFYLFSLPINWVDMDEPVTVPEGEYPYIVLFYPVLRELEETMRTTMVALGKMDYPRSRYSIIAIPNSNDQETIARLRRLQGEFPFLEVMEVPPTSDPSWQVVWDAWDANPKAYWWHSGRRAHVRDLPPKKTRQLIYAFYHTVRRDEPNLAINYIDADSAPPTDHFKAAVNGLRRYDVLQAQNVAGNLNASMPASWHAFDHMAWDGNKYAHLSANGRQPYWVLGKGLFFKAADLLALGGFHPWTTIEDPEVGQRFWINGKRLGIIEGSLVEEVPETWLGGITQRKRWVCGFFQALNSPLHEMDFSFWQRFKAWLIFLPCLSMWINTVGIPTRVWAIWGYLTGRWSLPVWTVWLSAINLLLFAISMTRQYIRTWKRTGLVLDRWVDRVWYLLRVNPISLMIWWVLWIIPLFIGYVMYLRDGGLVWQRTDKIDANHELVRAHWEQGTPQA